MSADPQSTQGPLSDAERPKIIEAIDAMLLAEKDGAHVDLEYTGLAMCRLLAAFDGAQATIAELRGERDKLAAAIRDHRGQTGDDRCWLDDLELYAVLGDNREPDLRLPPEREFLESCRRYWIQRQCPATAGTMRAGEKTIAQLEAQLAEAEARAGAMEIRIDDAAEALHGLADLLADSEELPVSHTPAVQTLNKIIDGLAHIRAAAGLAPAAGDAAPSGEQST